MYWTACISELSKVLMYDFQYDYIKNKYDSKTELLFTDTNRLMYEIQAENVYEDFCKDNELYDFSNYSKESNYYDKTNTLVVAKMKDETCDMPINFFVGLKAKVYTYITEDDHECKKAIGINRNVVDDELKYEAYKNILSNGSYMRYEMNGIQSKDHNLGTYRINKVSLSSYNDIYLKTDTMGHHIFINLFFC